MGLFNKFKSKTQETFKGSGGASPSAEPSFPPAPAPLPLEHSLARYRKQRGVNLGSWFTTESWLNTELYARVAKDPKGSDFDLARGDNAKAEMEKHWDTWVTEDDWAWIKHRGFNSVRLPIGYYHLSGALPDILKGTDFEPYADVYSGAWARILAAVETAGRYGLGVMIDLHAAPGGQNTEGHSGVSHGKIKFWEASNLKRTSLALRFLASTFVSNPNVVGLELLNEPRNDNRLAGWYEHTLNEVRVVAGRDFPIYFSDSWDMPYYCPWAGRRDDFVVVDHHLYRCFDACDRALTGPQHSHKICAEWAPQLHEWAQQARGQVVVGEWSAGLDDSCLPPDTPAGERDAHKREWVRAQLEVFERETAGYWFWTLKTDSQWNAGWSAKNAAQAEILPATLCRYDFHPPADGERVAAAHGATEQHVNYWNANGMQPDAEAFNSAFLRAWDDAILFFQEEGVNELGFKWQWSRRRREEFEHWVRGGVGALGSMAWQWDHGFDQGLKACADSALRRK